jgi:hypothetical protein
MLNLVRTLSLMLLLLLIAFPAAADNGLSSLSVAFERLLILFVWSMGSLALLIVSFIRYRRRKTIVPALLTYLSFVSLALLYTVVFYHFMDQSGSLIFDDTIDTMERDSDIAIYRMLIGFGCILVAAILAFGIYHWRSGRKD